MTGLDQLKAFAKSPHHAWLGLLTLGAGLAIGLVVDAAVRHVKNPQEDVRKEVERALDELAVRGKESLRQELERAVSERSMVWREVAKGMHRCIGVLAGLS